jgi:DNA replication protein DnaC
MRSSRLPAVKTLAGFDFSFQPSIRREQLESLHELGFLERKENVIFLGPPEPATYCITSLCGWGRDG